jgi:predicted RND superfamily exporter protein
LLRLAVLARFVLDRIDLDQYINWEATTARARIFVRSADYARARELLDHLEARLPDLLEPYGVRHHLSGDLAVAVEVVRAIVVSQLRSVAWTLLGIGLLLTAFFGNGRSAIALMLPVIAALPILLGVMGYAGIPLGIATTMFTALTVGVGVDFALHFSHAYTRAIRDGCEGEQALSRTLASAGRAIRWNATVLSVGFLVLTLSDLDPNHNLGLLLAGAMVTCYVTTLLLAPYLLLRHKAPGEPTAP